MGHDAWPGERLKLLQQFQSFKTATPYNQASQAKRLVIIVNVDDNHWIVVHANLPTQQIEVLDSWGATYRPSIGMHNWTESVHAPVIKVIPSVQSLLKPGVTKL